jgi:hypothetical protein
MIACDNSDCELEWVRVMSFIVPSIHLTYHKFHYGCVGLSEPPEGEWFCEDCRLRQDDM